MLFHPIFLSSRLGDRKRSDDTHDGKSDHDVVSIPMRSPVNFPLEAKLAMSFVLQHGPPFFLQTSIHALESCPM